MMLYCRKCHCLLQFFDKEDVGIAFEYFYKCPKCKYEIVKWVEKHED